MSVGAMDLCAEKCVTQAILCAEKCRICAVLCAEKCEICSKYFELLYKTEMQTETIVPNSASLIVRPGSTLNKMRK